LTHLSVDGGRLGYEVAGEGPLIVLAHGMGHTRTAYRFVAPRLIAAGYRVASADLRGCGGRKPGDWTARQAGIEAELRAPGRMTALRAMLKTSPADAGAQLAGVRCPALIIEGSLDPDWTDPRAEGEAIIAALPAGVGTLRMIDGAGHYPHDQYPDQTAALILEFLGANADV